MRKHLDLDRFVFTFSPPMLASQLDQAEDRLFGHEAKSGMAHRWPNSAKKSSQKLLYLKVSFVGILVAVVVFVQILGVELSPRAPNAATVIRKPAQKDIMMCPSQPISEANFEKDHYDYDGTSKLIMNNITSFLETFRQIEDYDQWGKSYAKVKELMDPWKRRVYANVQSGWKIYESACGIGLNLFMTLEILESLNLTDVFVYGNEYVDASVQVARRVAENLPGNGKLGAICTGDSSNLSFVPSNTFDLAYTGYITPLRDPLDSGLEDKKIDAYYQSICKSKKDSDIALKRTQKLRQEDWFAAWASELIRIAKPGAWIIIEQVSLPICEAPYDWDGVGEDFWYRAVQYYEQFRNIDQNTIEFEKDRVFRRRYHVRFRKSLS